MSKHSKFIIDIGAHPLLHNDLARLQACKARQAGTLHKASQTIVQVFGILYNSTNSCTIYYRQKIFPITGIGCACSAKHNVACTLIHKCTCFGGINSELTSCVLHCIRTSELHLLEFDTESFMLFQSVITIPNALSTFISRTHNFKIHT